MSCRLLVPFLVPLPVLPVAGLLPAQVLTLPPVADATTDQSQPTLNFGSDPEFNFGKAYSSSPFTVWFLRGHIRFDLSALQGLVPQRARLFWYQSRSSAAGCLDVAAHRLTASWSEGTVTWNNQPAHDPVAAATACVGDSFNLGWKEFDVTLLVQDWLAGVVPDHGLVIRDPRESTAGAARPGFGHSRESTAAMLRPYLELHLPDVFGAGCAGAGPPPSLSLAGGAPGIGGAFTVATQGLPSGSLPMLVLGFSNTQWGPLPLPLPLAALGFPGCDLLVSADAFLVFALLGQPVFDVTLSVPNDAALVGLSLFHQTAGLVPGALHASNGLGLVIH